MQVISNRLAATLGELIGDYDDPYYAAAPVAAVDMLHHLMEAHGLKQGDLPEIGSQGVVSEVLRGRRELNLRQVRALAADSQFPRRCSSTRRRIENPGAVVRSAPAASVYAPPRLVWVRGRFYNSAKVETYLADGTTVPKAGQAPAKWVYGLPADGTTIARSFCLGLSAARP